MFKFATQQILMEVFQTENTAFRGQITDLYIEAFSSGMSEQYIDLPELNLYLKSFFTDGKIIIAQDSNQLEGALLYCPLKMDSFLPDVIKYNFDIDKCLYIAEIMVAEEFRGKGIGTQLLHSFFETANRNRYSDVFIRVWDKNEVALSLYKKIGFEPVTSIIQKKMKMDKSGFFEMKKIYLHKKLV